METKACSRTLTLCGNWYREYRYIYLRDAFIIFYSKIDRVRELDFSGNRLSSTEFLQSSKFTIFDDLRLSENYLNSTFSATHSYFSNLTSLTHLYLSNSQLNNLNFLYDSIRVTSHLRSLKVRASVPVRSDYSWVKLLLKMIIKYMSRFRIEFSYQN